MVVQVAVLERGGASFEIERAFGFAVSGRGILFGARCETKDFFAAYLITVLLEQKACLREQKLDKSSRRGKCIMLWWGRNHYFHRFLLSKRKVMTVRS